MVPFGLSSSKTRTDPAKGLNRASQHFDELSANGI